VTAPRIAATRAGRWVGGLAGELLLVRPLEQIVQREIVRRHLPRRSTVRLLRLDCSIADRHLELTAEHHRGGLVGHQLLDQRSLRASQGVRIRRSAG
jgi:hypothetical protein